MYPSRSNHQHRSQRPTAARKPQLKDELVTILQTEDLGRKTKFVQTLAEESGADMSQIAAALLLLLEVRRRGRQDAPAQPGSRGANRDRYERGHDQPGRRPARERTRSSRGGASTAMAKYRIEVGRVHGVGPGQIVGAIANETELSGNDIGGIDIQTHFSTVDLPQQMSAETVRSLGQLRVAGQPLRLSKWERGGTSRLRERPKKFLRQRGGKPTWKKSRKRSAPPPTGTPSPASPSLPNAASQAANYEPGTLADGD